MGCFVARSIHEAELDKAEDVHGSPLEFHDYSSSKFLPPLASRSTKEISTTNSESVPQLVICSSRDDSGQLSGERPGYWNSSLGNDSTLKTPDCHPPLTEVTSQLYLGSFEDAKNEEELRSRGITHTICLIGPMHPIEGIEHRHNPMSDYGKTDLKLVLKKLSAFVEESQRPGKSLFVHCMSGQNRSATVVIAILMKIKRKSLLEAWKVVKNKRPVVQINEQYAKQLTEIELELFGRTSVSANWMEIRSANMETGKVVFFGDSGLFSSFASISPISSNKIRKRNPYKRVMDI